jgi:hypothetical protein
LQHVEGNLAYRLHRDRSDSYYERALFVFRYGGAKLVSKGAKEILALIVILLALEFLPEAAAALEALAVAL